MKNSTNLFKTLFLLAFGVCMVVACKKEVHNRPFKLQSKTWYRVSPTQPTPIVINNTTYTTLAYFPGGGTGTATHLGAITHYFNQLAYGTSADGPPAGSVAAPVVDVPSYQVTGGPLPLIQTGDFAELAAFNTSLEVPKEVYGMIVNGVITNEEGDALFTSAITGSGATFPLSETKIGFNGKALIVGGRGKFQNATGEIDYEGYFNVTNAADAEYNAEGWITYSLAVR